MGATFNRIRICAGTLPAASTTMRIQALRFYDKDGKAIPYTVSTPAAPVGTMTFNGKAYNYRMVLSDTYYSTSYYGSYAFSAYTSQSNKTYRSKAVPNTRKAESLYIDLIFDEAIDSRYIGRCSLLSSATSATGSYARDLKFQLYMNNSLRGEANIANPTSTTVAVYSDWIEAKWRFIVARRDDKLYFLDAKKLAEIEAEGSP